MKKLVTAILALIYIGTSIGVTINMHYCMGKLADWSFSASYSNSCPKCGMEKSVKKGKHCCSDEQKTFKNSTDQKAADLSLQTINSIAAAMPSEFVTAPDGSFMFIAQDYPVSNAPPSYQGVAIYILNRNFRI